MSGSRLLSADECRAKLTPFVLEKIEFDSSEELGKGAYGAVFEVTVNGVPCIAKRVHEVLVDRLNVSRRDRKGITEQFLRECVRLSELKHPNIVHFIGVHYRHGPDDVSLVMERLNTNVGKFVENTPNLPLSIKVSILCDVSYGLVYLHDKNILHRDLTANNIILTMDLQAKIADLGVSKMITIQQQVKLAQTKAPGSQYYMPPEALKENPKYNQKLDIFSFGHLSIYVAIQEFPNVYEVTITPAVLAQGIVQRLKRRKALDKVGEDHCLYALITSCLSDLPERRPSTNEVNVRMKQLSLQNPRRMQNELVQNELMQNELTELKEYIGELEESRQTLAKERGQLKEEKQKLEGELQVLKADMDQINQKMKRLETALQTSQDLSKSLKVENAALTGQLQKFGSLFNENSELHAAEVSTLQETVKKIERERDEVKSTLQATEAQVVIYKEDFETERADRERAHHQRTEEGERYKEEIERLHEELEHTKQQLKHHKGNLSNVEDVHLKRQKELTEQFELFRQEMEKMKKTLSKADLKAAKVTASKDLQEQLSKKTAENERIKVKSKQRKAKILELTSQYSNLRHEMERARRELEKHNTAREMKKSTSRVSVSSPISDTEMSSQMEMDQLKQQCTDLQSQNDDLLVEVRTLRDNNRLFKSILQEVSDGVDSGTSVDLPRQDGDATAVSSEDVSHSDLSKTAKQKGSRNIQENASRPRSQSAIEESRTTAGSGRFSGKKTITQLSSTSRQPTQHHQPIQPLPPAVHPPHVSAEQPRGIEGAGKIDVQHADRVNLSQAMTEESTSTSSQHRKPMPPAVPTRHARENEGSDQANADYVNHSRVQAILEEIKARKRQPSPESSHSAPAPADESLHLPPPFMTFPLDEQKGNSPGGVSYPPNAGELTTPDDVHGNIGGGYGRGQNVKSEHNFSSRGGPQQTAADMQGQSGQYYGGSGGYGGGAGGQGGGGYRAMGRGEEYGGGAQPKHQMVSEAYRERAGAGGEQGRGGTSGVVGGRGGHSGGTAGGGGRGEWRHSGGEYHEGGSGRIANQHELPYERYSNSGLTSLPAQSSSLTPAFQHQHSLEGTQPARTDAIAQQKANVQEQKQQALRLGRDVLTPAITQQLHVVAEDLGDDHEGGGVRQVTGVPYDPNLKCVLCGKEFRIGQIQLYRSHMATCG